MENINIEKIYQLIINQIELNHENLLSNGYTDEEIEILLENKIIRLNNNGYYEIVKPEKFYQYGVKLLVTRRIKEANTCFYECYKMAPNYRKINLQIFLHKIKKEKYQEAYEIYANLLKCQGPKHEIENNLYLYLLNQIEPAEEELRTKILKFNAKDLMYPNTPYNKEKNAIIKAIYNSKFTYACRLINDSLSKKLPEYSVKYELLKALVSRIIDKEKITKENLLYMAKTEQYNRIMTYLLELGTKKNLSKLENYILLLSGTIINILKTNQVPEKKIEITYDLYEALLGNNFAIALEINKEHHMFTERNEDEDTVYILLVKINELISKIESSTKKEEVNTDILDQRIEKEPIEELDKEIMLSEELAYYITSENMQLNEAIKKMGIRREQVLMIRLVYIRDYYVEGNTILADKLLEELREKETLTPTVIYFINKIKEYKENTLENQYTRRKEK